MHSPLSFMRRKTASALMYAWFAVGVGLALASAQEAQLITRDIKDQRVVVDVVAKPRLESAGAVTLTDNHVPIAEGRLHMLSWTDRSDAQAQLVIVIDAINSSFASISRSEEAVDAFLRSGSSQLPQLTSIFILSDTAAIRGGAGVPSVGDTVSLRGGQLFVHRIPASTDAAALVQSLDRYKIGLHRILDLQSGAGQAERVALSLQALSFLAKAAASEPGPKVVLWISPGWPLLAKSNAKSSDQVFDSVIYFSDLLRSARMILYSVNPDGLTSQDHSAETEAFLLSSRPGSIQANGHAPNIPVELTNSYYQNFLKGVRSAGESSPNDLALQVLAYQSGGMVLQQNNDLTGQIATCAADAQNISTFAYEPKSTGNTITYHGVEVRRAGDSSRLRSLRGFYTR